MVSDPNSIAPTPKASNGEGGQEDTKAEGRVIGGWASNDHIYLVDRACLELGQKRSQFVVESAVERARTVLAAKAQLKAGAEAA